VALELADADSAATAGMAVANISALMEHAIAIRLAGPVFPPDPEIEAVNRWEDFAVPPEGRRVGILASRTIEQRSVPSSVHVHDSGGESGGNRASYAAV
jgi:hypothetical protein